jgi:hypothetical protein
MELYNTVKVSVHVYTLNLDLQVVIFFKPYIRMRNKVKWQSNDSVAVVHLLI